MGDTHPPNTHTQGDNDQSPFTSATLFFYLQEELKQILGVFSFFFSLNMNHSSKTNLTIEM